jgi:hypothetical protein
MARDKNVFGGGNPNGLYVPMSEVEQEAISRLVESRNLKVVIKDWGFVAQPTIVFGDARIRITFKIIFDRPAEPRELSFLDMELRTHEDRLLYSSREPTLVEGKPLVVFAGLEIDMAWNIQVHSIDPALVKELVPAAIGLTSRLQDRDTKDFTLEGNMRLTQENRKLLKILRNQEAKLKR